jgi:hypothetical protein
MRELTADLFKGERFETKSYDVMLFGDELETIEAARLAAEGDHSVPYIELVRGQAALPDRDCQISVTLEAAYGRGAVWPPRLAEAYDKLKYSGGFDAFMEGIANEIRPIEEVIAESEATSDPIDVKNARIIGMLAAIHDDELSTDMTWRQWRLAPHTGMLNALGAALISGLSLSAEAVKLAANLHAGNTDSNNLRPAEEIYASPGCIGMVDDLRDWMSGAYHGALESEIEEFMAYYTNLIDFHIAHLPPGRHMLATYPEQDNGPAIRLYRYIAEQVIVTKDALLDRSGEIDLMRQAKLSHYDFVGRQMLQEEGPDIEPDMAAQDDGEVAITA